LTPPPTPPRLAPLHLRLFALILDYLLATTVLKLLDLATVGEHWDLRPVSEGVPGPTAGWAAGLVLLLLARDVLGGKSPGKWLTGLAVGRAENPEARAPLLSNLLRNLPLLILPVEGLLVFVHPYGRRLGDRLAGTVVVAPAQVSPLSRRLMGLAVLFLGVLLVSFLLGPWNVRRSAAYQVARGAAAAHPEVAAAVGAPAELNASPSLELAVRPDGGSATLVFEARGPRGKAEAQVELRLETAPRRWKLEALTVRGRASPEPLVKEAPGR
jgi:uncharacterized RDD family membrane protein YckC